MRTNRIDDGRQNPRREPSLAPAFSVELAIVLGAAGAGLVRHALLAWLQA